ncbi:BZ3500_MvSof-1268-A1-R1_Chr1-3g01582 [Microbotryum saponariae]|uniref:BZ3500_MvSof-1268-A1-R1_Chr1-3g01582 protein n=1 Tax=Microbotryum saponariae TaxID=289078 RepID=A0A2X0MIN7_9BASI|nr:BZ3500_MvSof-1268-A1-R1_Chr1-3g01582 [Microbotryum saponariae]SCZ94090.1 BZ3501_MvSof-1269-A2-R1_Chr1-3g01184 [Microbotryum saponariae]
MDLLTRRLSDRRRSGERHTRAANFIIFSHPSGAFLKGDASRLNVITRKTRNRHEKRESSSSAGSKRNARRYSDISQDSYEDSDQVHFAQVANYLPEACWQHATNPFDNRYYDIHRNSQCTSLPPTSDSYSHDSRDEMYASYTSNMGQLKLACYPQPPASATSYETSDLAEDLRANAPITDFKIASMSLAPNAHSLPSSVRRSLTSSPSFAESRTRSPSHLFLPPIALTFNAPVHGEPLPSPNFYAHAYPTPEFSPTTQTHFHLARCQYQDAPYHQI